jgi:hypothetical protein
LSLKGIAAFLSRFCLKADKGKFKSLEVQKASSSKEGSRMEGTLDVDCFNLGGSFKSPLLVV